MPHEDLKAFRVTITPSFWRYYAARTESEARNWSRGNDDPESIQGIEHVSELDSYARLHGSGCFGGSEDGHAFGDITEILTPQ